MKFEEALNIIKDYCEKHDEDCRTCPLQKHDLFDMYVFGSRLPHSWKVDEIVKAAEEVFKEVGEHHEN